MLSLAKLIPRLFLHPFLELRLILFHTCLLPATDFDNSSCEEQVVEKNVENEDAEFGEKNHESYKVDGTKIHFLASNQRHTKITHFGERLPTLYQRVKNTMHIVQTIGRVSGNSNYFFQCKLMRLHWPLLQFM